MPLSTGKEGSVEEAFEVKPKQESHAVKERPSSSREEGRRAATSAAENATKRYFLATAILGAIILPISIVLFINTAISNDVATLLKENDAAIVAIYDQLVNDRAMSAPSGADRDDGLGTAATREAAPQTLQSATLVKDMAQFARVNRQIFAESRVLNFFILHAEQEPWWWAGPEATPALTRANLELDVRAGDVQHASVVNQGFEKLATYQDIRDFARSAQQMNLVIYGAVTAYVLPIAYALLGACAFALRSMVARGGTRSYPPPYSNRARLIIAAIAGAVVGLFNNFTDGVSVSPLAVAFLVGYAVEVFFSFLDAIVHSFDQVRDAKGLRATP
jgi:hypothetical protein